MCSTILKETKRIFLQNYSPKTELCWEGGGPKYVLGGDTKTRVNIIWLFRLSKWFKLFKKGMVVTSLKKIGRNVWLLYRRYIKFRLHKHIWSFEKTKHVFRGPNKVLVLWPRMWIKRFHGNPLIKLHCCTPNNYSFCQKWVCYT